MSKQSGVTLIELSVVLVIIGLIVGGILAGQAIIESSRVRGTLSQLQSHLAAAANFQTKYGALPGDLSSEQAAKLNFPPSSRPSGDGTVSGIRHNDGRISASVSGAAQCTTTCTPALGYEVAMFWQDLNSAKMISESFVDAFDGPMTTTIQQIGKYLPKAKIDGVYFIPFSPLNSLSADAPAGNYFALTGVTAINAVTGQMTIRHALSPSQAKVIDTKMDDGAPTTGVVHPFDGTVLAAYATLGASSTCNHASSPLIYKMEQPDAVPGCSLSIRW